MITPTEDDASPETRFIRRVESGRVPLPNDRWLRSPKLKDYALCFDDTSPHCCRLMLETWDNGWTPIRSLTLADLVELRDGYTEHLSAAHLEFIRVTIELTYAAKDNHRGL